MRSRHGASGALAALLILLDLSVPSSSRAGGVGVSTPGQPTDSLNQIAACCDSFNLYRLKRYDFPVPNTDLEFLWSETYHSRYNQPLVADTTVTNDLDRLGLLLAWNPDNPYGLNASDIQLLYNYFNWPGGARPDVYDERDQAPHHYLLAAALPGGTPYPEADQNHVDSYLYAPNTAFPGWPEIGYPPDSGDGGKSRNAYRNYGLTNSDFVSRIEDISSLHPALPDSIYHLNSLMIPGPRRYLIGSTEWTVAGGRPNWMWNHEFQHVLNPFSSLWGLHELWSSLAEAVGGELPDPPLYDCPYTWSLVHPGFYQAWRSFGSYVVSNFRNGTQQITDDLVYRWAHGGDASLAGLALRLRNSECPECASLSYMAGDTSGTGRLGLMIHNWRVAQYADTSEIYEHQYGFPLAFGFKPSRDVGVFQSVNEDPGDDNITIPPDFIVTAAYKTRDTVYRARPPIHSSPARPLETPMMGAEYLVLHGDAGLAGTQQTLVVRIIVDSLRVRDKVNQFGCEVSRVADAYLYASVITYSHDDTALFRHPSWITGISTQRVFLDSLRGDLTFEVSGFGGSVKAAVLVVTLEDGPIGYYLSGNETVSLPFAVSVALKAAPYLTPDPVTIQATPSSWDDWPAWSPAGDEVTFHALIPAVSSYVQIYRGRLDGGPPARLSPAAATQYEPDWSPRGDYVAFEQGGGGQSDIYLKDPRTGSPAVRASFQTGYAHSPSFRPNGEGLAYILDPPGEIQPMELRLLNLAYGAPFYDELVATLPPLDDVHPLRWSPDGDTLFFFQHDSLYAAWILGGWQPRLDVLGGRLAKAMDLSNDGARVVYDRPDSARWATDCIAFGCGCVPFGEFTNTYPVRFLAVRERATGQWERRFYTAGVQYYNPRLSLDGTKVAYSADPNLAGDRDLLAGAITYDHPPQFTGLNSDYNAIACVPFGILLNASDPDGQPVTYSVALAPAGSELAGNVFRWSYPYVGDYSVVLRAKDGTGGADNRVVKIHVTDGGYCEGELIVQGGTPDGWTTEGTVLGPAAAGTTTDIRRLPSPLQTLGGRAAVRFLARGTSNALLDRVRLVAVDHAPRVAVYALGGGFAPASLTAASRIVNGAGKDVTALLDAGYDAAAGEVLSVDLGSAVATSAVIVEARGRNGAATAVTEGILVQRPRGDGTWETVRQVFPRGEFDRFVVDSVGGTVRLAFLGAHSLKLVGSLVPNTATPDIHVLPLISARQSQDGDVSAVLAKADGSGTTASAADTVTALFATPPPEPGAVRDWFIVAEGSVSGSSGGTRAATLRAVEGDVPVAFALLQNRPNPFGASTEIRFELPQSSKVQLEVFDLQGRCVRNLASGQYPAGRHAINWNHRSASGSTVEPGVYIYRLTAGSFRAQKKMTLLGR